MSLFRNISFIALFILFFQVVIAQPNNDDCVEARKLCPGVAFTGTTSGATVELGGADGDGTSGGTWGQCYDVNNSVWFSFRTNSAGGDATVSIITQACDSGSQLQAVLLEAVSSYLDILRQIELTSLSQDNINTLKRQLQLEDERVQRGSGIAVDVLQSKSRLQIAKERNTAFKGALNDAKSRFTQVFGTDPIVGSMTRPDIPFDEILFTLYSSKFKSWEFDKEAP